MSHPQRRSLLASRRAAIGPEILVVLLALVLLGLAAWSWTGIDGRLPQIDPPAVGAQRAVHFVRLEVPPIGDFAHYYGRPERDPWVYLNPFVPHRVRLEEQSAHRRAAVRRQQANRVDERTAAQQLPPPPAPPPIIEEVPPPSYPALSVAQLSRPEMLGSLASGGATLVFVRFSPDGVIAPLEPGDEREGWTLLAIAETAAVFRDADGVELRLRLSSGGPAVTTLSLDRTGEVAVADAGTGGQAGPEQGGRPEGGRGRGRREGGMEALEGMSSQQLIDMAQQDPRLREVIANPRVRQMIEEDPQRALRMMRRFAR